MSCKMLKDPETGMILPASFVDAKQSLKKSIDEIVDRVVLENQHIKQTYYLTLHMKFDSVYSDEFRVDAPVITYKLPPFTSNQFVFWVNNSKGICELLWMVTRKQDGHLRIEFNKQGVAYLQAKGAMPK